MWPDPASHALGEIELGEPGEAGWIIGVVVFFSLAVGYGLLLRNAAKEADAANLKTCTVRRGTESVGSVADAGLVMASGSLVLLVHYVTIDPIHSGFITMC